jgi:hypothetical protein
MGRRAVYHLSTLLFTGLLLTAVSARTQTLAFRPPSGTLNTSSILQSTADSSNYAPQGSNDLSQEEVFLNAWGADILISDGGFGLGAFYRREFTPDLFGFVSISASESKDDREVEQFDPYYQISYVPGKLNRFFSIPVMFGVQQRLFREDILDTFRPYVNAGAGPALIYVAPFTEISGSPADLQFTQVEFFKSLGKGRMHYTAGGFIGIGANFGSEKASLFGINFRYYFTYLFSGGLPSLFNTVTGEVSSTKSSFGAFYITLNVGTAY